MNEEKSAEVQPPQCSYWMMMHHLARNRACEDPDLGRPHGDEAVVRFIASFFKADYEDVLEDLANVVWAKSVMEAEEKQSKAALRVQRLSRRGRPGARR